jgi:glycosyltransferase involved in cell wall biosynthesis
VSLLTAFYLELEDLISLCVQLEGTYYSLYGENGTESMQLSIIVLTFRRPNQLRQCIDSCLAQSGLEGGTYEIIVVDNCPQKTAFDTVMTFQSAARPVTYVHEPRSGIAFARNRGVNTARSQLIAFIDDDEVADGNWLVSLLRAQSKFDADIVFGPVIALLEEGSDTDPQFVREFYTADRRQSSGPVDGSAYTGNVLLRRDRCFRGGHEFNPNLGLTGGEDTLFFLELARANASFVWCKEAIVFQLIAPHRTTYSYMLKRCIVRGQSVPRTRWLLRPPDWKGVVWFMMTGLLQFLFFGLAAVITAPISTHRTVRAASRALLGLGKVFWMQPFQIDFYGPTGSA